MYGVLLSLAYYYNIIQHDTTVAAFLSALQIFDDIQPPYAATVFVELYGDSKRSSIYVCSYFHVCIYEYVYMHIALYVCNHPLACVHACVYIYT